MGWKILSFLLMPIHLFPRFLKSGDWYFIYWDKGKCDVLELELFGKHIFYLFIPLLGKKYLVQ